MRIISCLLFNIVFCGIVHAGTGTVVTEDKVQELDRLTDPSYHLVEIYKGKLHMPVSFKQNSDGFWYDDTGENMTDPVINFAGKYYISVRGCGNSCKLYRIYDMTNGKELMILNMFANTKLLNKTRDGWEYTSRLSYRADSRLLVVQYWLSKLIPQNNGKFKTIYGCREKSFIIENEIVKAISGTRHYCSNEHKDKWFNPYPSEID